MLFVLTVINTFIEILNENGSITVREAARIQSFQMITCGSSRNLGARKQDEAVPVLMAEGIANKIKECYKIMQRYKAETPSQIQNQQ